MAEPFKPPRSRVGRQSENVAAGQRAFTHRAKMNGLAASANGAERSKKQHNAHVGIKKNKRRARFSPPFILSEDRSGSVQKQAPERIRHDVVRCA